MDKRIEEILANLTSEEKSRLTAGSDLWHSYPLESHGVPALRMSDGPNGVRGLAKDTDPETSASFPVGIAMAATWNPALIEQIGQALGQEARSKGVHVVLGPTVNIHRAPNAGRNFECFSEDPYLSSQAAIAYIQGVQREGVAACVKHFICNDQETERLSISAEVSDRALQEIYLPPFKAAVMDAGVQTIMSAYNRLNGVYASENRELLIDRLKQEWGFDGLVISDWYGTYSHDAAFNGCDLEMPGPARWMGLRSTSGELFVDQEILNDNVRRLLRTLFRTHAFAENSPEQLTADEFDHQELIKRTGTEAIVLLKNEGDILPLAPDQTRKIALIGLLAEQASFQGGGSSQVTPHYVSSPLDALSKSFKGEIQYAQGYDIRKQPPALDHTWLINKDPDTGPLVATYYANTRFAGKPVHEVSYQASSLGWFGETAEHWDPKGFSLHLEGQFQPPISQEYTFTLGVVGRGRVFIDHELVLDLSRDPSTERSAEFDLELDAKREYALRIEYISDLDLRWRSLHLGVAPAKEPDLLEEAINLAGKSDLALVFAGLSPDWESEGFDRENLTLPGDQDLLIQEIARVNPKTIVILQTGSPVVMPWLDAVPGVIQSWYLGQECGSAIAEVIAGSADPGGRLPITFPVDIKDNPAYDNFPGKDGKVHYREGIFIGYRHYDKTGIKPLFPFGHGLSYTSFEYDKIRLNGGKFQSGDEIEVNLEITNTGNRPGFEVAQLYLSALDPVIARPPKELKAFQKIHLIPGETVTVTFRLNQRDLAYYDSSLKAWQTDPGTYRILIGRSSKNIQLSKSFTWE